MIRELIEKNRSYRRFFQDHQISGETLRELVGLARLGASASNRQPLRYILSNEPDKNALIFETLGWARFIEDWPCPSEGERPSAYVVILRDNEVGDSCGCDHGIAAQNILLGAVEKGLGGCMFGSMKKQKLRESLSIPDLYDIVLVVALGKPKEKVVVEEVKDGDTRYWRDDAGTHHVPKWRVDELVLDI
ncbi:nitroreductase family protein [bacterium]|nr:nitroreductase family protein [bacterium]